MLLPRIIPCLLVKDKGLVKTVKFDNAKYVGDPINAVKIFNEKRVDEIIVLDIDASSKKFQPDYRMIENLATECRMPLCYGGGIKTVEQAQTIFSLGVEKIAISSAAVERPEFITDIAERVGASSVVIVLDVRKRILSSKYDIYTYNGRYKQSVDLMSFIDKITSLGAGEVVINMIDHDGTMKGYDFALIEKIRKKITMPMTALGGAGSLEDISTLIAKHKIIGAAAGSLFVFKGKYRAVLINYPSICEKMNLIQSHKFQ